MRSQLLGECLFLVLLCAYTIDTKDHEIIIARANRRTITQRGHNMDWIMRAYGLAETFLQPLYESNMLVFSHLLVDNTNLNPSNPYFVFNLTRITLFMTFQFYDSVDGPKISHLCCGIESPTQHNWTHCYNEYNIIIRAPRTGVSFTLSFDIIDDILLHTLAQEPDAWDGLQILFSLTERTVPCYIYIMDLYFIIEAEKERIILPTNETITTPATPTTPLPTSPETPILPNISSESPTMTQIIDTDDETQKTTDSSQNSVPKQILIAFSTVTIASCLFSCLLILIVIWAYRQNPLLRTRNPVYSFSGDIIETGLLDSPPTEHSYIPTHYHLTKKGEKYILNKEPVQLMRVLTSWNKRVATGIALQYRCSSHKTIQPIRGIYYHYPSYDLVVPTESIRPLKDLSSFNANCIPRLLNHILDAISYLNTQLIIHRNVDRQAIYVTADLQTIRLHHFEDAMQLKALDDSFTEPGLINPHIATSEMIKTCRYTIFTDIYAFGLIAIELTENKTWTNIPTLLQENYEAFHPLSRWLLEYIFLQPHVSLDLQATIKKINQELFKHLSS